MLGVDRQVLLAYLEACLNASSFSDDAPNGLQVEGKPTVSRLCTAVTASLEVIEQAKAFSADALLVHHGYFWKHETKVLLGMKKQRIAALLNADINLFAYHLPLDCHLLVGNNAQLAKRFQAQEVNTHEIRKTPHLLWSGILPEARSFKAFQLFLNQSFGRTVQTVQAEEVSTIRRIAWCSGAAQDLIEDAAHLGVDAYISGEVSERTYYLAKELGVHYFACGHHATECDAVQVLGHQIADQFGIKHLYINVENPF